MKRLIALFVLLPLVAFGQLMPIQRNFFTTNPSPVVTVSAGSNVTVQAATTFNTRTFTVNGQTDTNVVSILATNAASGAPIYGSNVVGAVAQATHATNADNATYVTTGQLTNQMYATNVVSGGQLPIGTVATNSAFDGAFLSATNSGTARVWSQYLTPTNVIVQNNALGTTITPTVWLTNGTAAALGAQQVSPALMFGGHGYRTGNSTEMPVSMGFYMLPAQGGSANPVAQLFAAVSISNATPTAVSSFYLNSSGGMRAADITSATWFSSGGSSYYEFAARSRIYSPADGDLRLTDQAGTTFSRLFLGSLTAAWPALKVESTNYPTLSLRNGADNNYTSLLASNVIASANVIATNSIISYGTGTSNYIGGDLFTSGTVSPTNGLVLQMKPSFYTNFTCLTNIQYYCCNGTNQLITLPNAANVPGIVFRFGVTNGYAKVIITNANGAQTIRDGTSLSFTQVGIGNPAFISDGAAWWPAARTKVVFPNACWSLTTNLLLTADVITNVPFNQLEFNNSQGIALVAPGQFYITNSGQYMLTFSAVINGGGNNTSISLWMRQSGVDVPRSRTRQVFTSATAQQCMTVNYIFNVATNNTYFELYAASHDTGAGIISEAANPTTYTAPVQPGVIFTINKISETFP